MIQTHRLYEDIAKNGKIRKTRSGNTKAVFVREFRHDMRERFPLPNTKSVNMNLVLGELLWFASGMNDLPSLRRFSCLSEDAWTIWTDDCKRWHSVKDRSPLGKEDLGKLYGHQWRNFGDSVDQLANLVEGMKSSPTSRYLLVQAYNPKDVAEDAMALPPCHTGFQVFVDTDTGEFDLDWTQRSVDSFLGLPFNIASYASLMVILGELTGLTPRILTGSLKDTHIYEDHFEAVMTQYNRTILPSRVTLKCPPIKLLDDLTGLVASDFEVLGYSPQPAIRAKLSVG